MWIVEVCVCVGVDCVRGVNIGWVRACVCGWSRHWWMGVYGHQDTRSHCGVILKLIT